MRPWAPHLQYLQILHSMLLLCAAAPNLFRLQQQRLAQEQVVQEEKLAVLAEPTDCEEDFYHYHEYYQHHVNRYPHDRVITKTLITNHLKAMPLNCLDSNPPTMVGKVAMVVDPYCHYHQSEIVVNQNHQGHHPIMPHQSTLLDHPPSLHQQPHQFTRLKGSTVGLAGDRFALQGPNLIQLHVHPPRWYQATSPNESSKP